MTEGHSTPSRGQKGLQDMHCVFGARCKRAGHWEVGPGQVSLQHDGVFRLFPERKMSGGSFERVVPISIGCTGGEGG